MPFIPSALRRQPLVSLILCSKNGMPHVRDAVASVAGLSYPRVELIVQDCVSDDGTRELLEAADLPCRVDIVSEPDSGIGDAYNRALARCRGDVIGSIDADNLLAPDSLELAVEELRRRPPAAAVYGSVQMVDAGGRPLEVFVPADFDVHSLLRCELVPPFSTAFFSRRVCGDALHIDESLATCADFDLWLRLSDLPIRRVDQVLGSTRVSDKSMTRNPARYDQFCTDKLAALARHFAERPAASYERNTAVAGIYCWAAESLLALEGDSRRFRDTLSRAEAAAPEYGRIELLRARAAA
jgi:glycosyltransferase involved in cell wall biosynthesis